MTKFRCELLLCNNKSAFGYRLFCGKLKIKNNNKNIFRLLFINEIIVHLPNCAVHVP